MTEKAFRHHLAGPVFKAIADIGFKVSVFDLRQSLFGTIPAAIEAHAVDNRKKPVQVHVVKVLREGYEDAEIYRLACHLANSVGIKLQ